MTLNLTYDPASISTFGSKEREVDRTAEMVITLARSGRQIGRAHV